MSEWSEYFHKNMQMPELIRQNALFYDAQVLASNTNEVILDSTGIVKARNPQVPREAINIGDAKFFYVRDICDDKDGYSLSLYQKVKKADEKEETLFIARMDNFLWAGRFYNEHRAEVVPYVEAVASYIFMYFVQREEQ